MGKYNWIEKNGKKGKGKLMLLRHLNNEKLTQRQAIYAKCYECMGYYLDGKEDCGIISCPLYPWMPYGDAAGPESEEGEEGRSEVAEEVEEG